MSTVKAAQAVAILRGIADDYSRHLREHGYSTLAAMITATAKGSSDDLVNHLRAERHNDTPPEPSTEVIRDS